MEVKHVNSNIQDEIDLLNLLRKLWQSKGFIVLMSFLGGIIGACFLVFHKPVYQANAALTIPITTDLAEINFDRNEVTLLKPFSATDAYNILRGVLFAESVRKDFKKLEVSRKFAGIPVIKVEPTTTSFAVTATAQNPDDALEALKLFLKLVEDVSIDKLNVALNHEIKVVKSQVKKALLAQEKTDSKDSTYPLDAKVLKEKISGLGKHSSSKAPHYNAQLQQQYDALTDIKLEDVSLLRFDGDLFVSDEPIGLNVKRTLFIFFAAGLMLGTIIVALRHIKQQVSI